MGMTALASMLVDVDAEINTGIESFFAHQIAKAASHGGQYPALWRAARTASRGGKRLRPTLVVNVYQALCDGELQHAVSAATAFELLHTAFLMHDDVIDRDTVRRGDLNIIGSFARLATQQGAIESDALLWGQASAILAGDLLIQASQSLLARLPISDSQRIALLDLFDNSVFVSAAGELADVAFATGVVAPAMAEVLAMAEQKTASYSFEGPLVAGAILANAPESIQTTLGEFGRLIGTAFQLRDDILGVFGDENLTGKSVISDIRDGKITPMVAFALESSDAGMLRKVMARPELVAADGEVVRAILQRCGARAFVEDLVVEHVRRALATIESDTVPMSLQAILRDVAERATIRCR